MEGEGSEAAGSVAAAAAPSETSAESSGPQPGPAAEESMQQGGSVNWGQATAQSPVRGALWMLVCYSLSAQTKVLAGSRIVRWGWAGATHCCIAAAVPNCRMLQLACRG